MKTSHHLINNQCPPVPAHAWDSWPNRRFARDGSTAPDLFNNHTLGETL